MMPDLGKYAGAVAWSYLATVALLAGLVLWSLWKSTRVKAALAEVEARQGNHNG